MLNPLYDVPGGISGYIKANRTPINLHFLKASDATLVSISWPHAITDTLGLGEIVKEWEEQIRVSGATLGSLNDRNVVSQPEDYYKFADTAELDKSWVPFGWFEPNIVDILKMGWRILYDMWFYPTSRRTLYISRSIVQSWVKDAEKTLNEGDFVSSNDLVTAWVFKHGYSHFSDNDLNNLSCAINFRGRHPLLPKTLIGNIVTGYPSPPYTSLALRNASVPSVALGIRNSLKPFSEPDFVAKRVAFEIRSLREGRTMLPFGNSSSRICIMTTWAKCGVTSPDFGKDVKTLCCIPHIGFALAGVSIVVDDSEGGWRVSALLTNQAWHAMEAQLKRELDVLNSEV